MINKPPILDVHTLLWVKDMMHEHPFLVALEKVMGAISHAEKVQEESWMDGEPPVSYTHLTLPTIVDV